MSEMIERSARAITPGWETASRNSKENARITARTVIDEMSDPTPEMVAAMVRVHLTPRDGTDETLVHDIWQAACDAALADDHN